MPEPLFVYLDNQDYSHMAQEIEKNGRSEYFNILKSAVDSQKINIFYSYFIFYELVKYERKFADKVKLKVRLLSNLTNGNAIMPFFDLAKMESRKIGLGEEIKKEDGHSRIFSFVDELDWMPDPEKYVVAEIEKSIENSGLNRKSRRATKRMAQKIRLKEKRDVLESYLETKKINTDIPIPSRVIKDIFREYCESGFDKSIIKKRLLEIIGDPEILVPLIYEWYDGDISALDFPRIISGQIEEILRDFESDVDRILEKNVLDIKNIGKKMGKDFWSRKAVENIGKIIIRSIGSSVENPENFKSVFVITSFIGGIMAKLLAPKESRRRIKSSDAIDIFHAASIPYVDVFRCDSANGGILLPIGKAMGCQIAPKRMDLLKIIETL